MEREREREKDEEGKEGKKKRKWRGKEWKETGGGRNCSELFHWQVKIQTQIDLRTKDINN